MTKVAWEDGEREATYLPTTTDSIPDLLRVTLRVLGLKRFHSVIDFTLDVVREGLVRRLCSFE
jgi:hypothetical protein